MNNKRAGLITAAAFLSILLLIAAAVLFLHGRGGRSVRNDAVPYPYQWTEKRNGSVALTLDGGAMKEGLWATDVPGSDVVSVTLSETRHGKAAAMLTPASEGRAELSFTLMNGDRRLAELRLAVETSEKEGRRAVTVIDHSEKAAQETVSGGREDHPYTAYTDDAGYLVLYISDSAASAEDESALSERWTAESSDELAASVIELRDAEGGAEVRLSTHVNGSAEVTVAGEEANVTYRFAVVSENGALRLRDCVWSDYVPQTPSEDEMNEILSGIADSLGKLERATP
ncbi:MAG: hypothetical protein IJV64_04315 [Oscillospiraceae bacterium]|nr:hypothetical protein [Oscillospiraceae bacterium]